MDAECLLNDSPCLQAIWHRTGRDARSKVGPWFCVRSDRSKIDVSTSGHNRDCVINRKFAVGPMRFSTGGSCSRSPTNSNYFPPNHNSSPSQIELRIVETRASQGVSIEISSIMTRSAQFKRLARAVPFPILDRILHVDPCQFLDPRWNA
jgi:hypothetical protein